jgi:circadian clock protein KaiC
MELHPYVATGQLAIRAIDPAELSPGEFAFQVRQAVEHAGVGTVVIDSLNAYLQAMPGQKFLLLQMHELLTYLNQQGVVTLLILAQHGFIGEVRSDIDLSYLSDSILLFRFFEAAGAVRTAISAVKSRTTAHEKIIREIRLTSRGIEIGEALTDFRGVMSGLPSYDGAVAMLGAEAPVANG